MEAYVGLDVHSKRSVFVIEAEDGRVVARGDIPTTPEGFRRLRRQHELAAETRVAVAHRLCRILFALLRDGVAFDIAKLAVEEGPFRRTSVQRYRLKRAPARRRA